VVSMKLMIKWVVSQCSMVDTCMPNYMVSCLTLFSGFRNGALHSFCGENMRHGNRVSGQYFVLDVTDLCSSLKDLLHPLFAVLKV